MRTPIAALLLILALPALAQEEPVKLPKPRPVETTEPAAPPPPLATPDNPATPLPRPRPDPDAVEPAADAPKKAPANPVEPGDPAAEPAEIPTPPRIYQSACPAVLAGEVEATMLPPIADKQCGASSPLALTGVLVNGRMVPVSGGVTTSCGMATALPGWVASIDAYLFARENTRVDEVLVGTSYMCRNVNNGEGGNLSFHAFADALDIIGFRLADGRTVTVAGGWDNALSAEGRLLRFAHDSACAHFTTTLGPEANALHEDHLHIDMGCHGKTCTARLCE